MSWLSKAVKGVSKAVSGVVKTVTKPILKVTAPFGITKPLDLLFPLQSKAAQNFAMSAVPGMAGIPGISRFMGGGNSPIATAPDYMPDLSQPFTPISNSPFNPNYAFLPGVSPGQASSALTMGGGVMSWAQALPQLLGGGMDVLNQYLKNRGPATSGGTVPALTTSVPSSSGTNWGQMAQVMLGATGAALGGAKTKRGKLSGNLIPRGYVERMSKQGVIYLAKSARRGGISSRDLRAYRRVDRLVRKYARHTTHHRRAS